MFSGLLKNHRRQLSAFVSGLVHESVADDEIERLRHRSFIVTHFISGLVALIVLAGLLISSAAEVLILSALGVWMMAPLAIAVFLSRTGRLELAYMLSALNLAGLVTVTMAATGGILSPLAIWMVIVPLEAALSGNRRVIAWSIGAAGLCLVGLSLAGALNILPLIQPLGFDPASLALFAALSAAIYAAGLAITIQSIHNQSDTLIGRTGERYRLLADNTTGMITRHDSLGDVVYASPSTKRLLGEPPEKVLGDGLFAFVHPKDLKQLQEALLDCQLTQCPATVEFRIQANQTAQDARSEQPETDVRWVEMNCRPVEPHHHDPRQAHTPQIVAVTRDITERKAQQARLANARDEAEMASRAKTRFLATVSHELRTPLTAIIGFSQLLERQSSGEPDREEARGHARIIHENGQLLLRLVNDVLDISKLETGTMLAVRQAIDVARLVQDCCADLNGHASSKSVEIISEIEPNLPALIADKKASRQILSNILANAVKFSENGGTVTIKAFSHRGTIAVSVKDNGIGIGKADLQRLTEPFFQANSDYDRRYDGAGLGLTLAQRLTDLNDGRMEIESEFGQGTVVTVYLPAKARKLGQKSYHWRMRQLRPATALSKKVHASLKQYTGR